MVVHKQKGDVTYNVHFLLYNLFALIGPLCQVVYGG